MSAYDLNVKIKNILDCDLKLNSSREMLLSMIFKIIYYLKTDEQKLVIAHILIDNSIAYMSSKLIKDLKLENRVFVTLQSLYKARITLRVRDQDVDAIYKEILILEALKGDIMDLSEQEIKLKSYICKHVI
jgi:hypothetical protein